MSGTHVIRRQLLEVELAGTESDAFALQERLPELSRDWLGPMLEDVLERVVPAHEHWLVDRLYVDAGTLRRENFERSFVAAVAERLEQQLRERVAAGSAASASAGAGASRLTPQHGFAPPDAVERRSEAESLRHAFVYFLQTGVLPWWLHLPPERTLEERIRELWEAPEHSSRPEDFARALAGVIRDAPARLRLVRQFSADFLGALLAAVSRQGASIVRETLAQLVHDGIPPDILLDFAEHLWDSAFIAARAAASPTAEQLIAEALRPASSGERPPPALLVELIARRWPAALERVAAESSDRAREPRTPPPHLDLDEGVYVGCAGVVLLHPFLPRLFEALGIAKEDKLLQPERALALLHFLATGRRSAPEYDLLVPKLLCNVPHETPVRSRVELKPAEEEEARALLEAVVRHWQALGDTSIDSLRGTYLARPGKLSRRGSDHVLQVESRSYDVLLDRLPWGIGAIELPWMERMLWVEWRF